MSKRNKRKIKYQKNDNRQLRGKKIADEAFETTFIQDTDDMTPTFSFKSCSNNRFKLSEWQPKEIEQLISVFKKLESCSWKEIRRNKGFGYKIVDPDTFSCNLPENISPDETIIELRVSKKARLFGYRGKNIFYIIWFDRNHEVYPMS